MHEYDRKKLIDGWPTWDLSPTQTLLNSFPGRRQRTGHMENHYKMYHCCEVFCGCAAVSRAMEEKGYRCFRFDVRRGEQENIHTVAGIESVAHAMVQTYPVKGLAVFEPTCSSWIFISLGSTLRQIESCISLYNYHWKKHYCVCLSSIIFILKFVFYAYLLGHGLKPGESEFTRSFTRVCFVPAQEIHGNPAVQSVICGNSRASILGCLLLPLAQWLYLPWLCEQPVLPPDHKKYK